jgi:hypothetical protein
MLKTETLTIEDKTFTLGEHTLYMDFKREELISKAIEENKADADIARQLMRIGYVNLTASIVDGTPPSFEDVLFRVSTDDTSRWSDAARRLNPQWFPNLTPSPSPKEGEGLGVKKKKTNANVGTLRRADREGRR